jgi:nucleoside-diphosphate-sugar epimerase
MEAMVRASGLEWCILRGGAFYGPGSGQDEAWREAALGGTLRWPGDGGGRLSLSHTADMASAVALAAEAPSAAGAIYNVVDDEPVTYRELYIHLAAVAGPSAAAGPGDGAGSSLACSNAKIKAALGWRPAFPTYREGLAGLG